MALRFTPLASVRASTHRRTLPYPHGSPSALDLFAQLTRDGRAPGSTLLERAGPAGCEPYHGLILPEALLRLRYRAGELVVEALNARGVGLLAPLAARLGFLEAVAVGDGRLTARVPAVTSGPGEADRQRLLRPCVLDAVRALVTLVGDASENDALPIAVQGSFGYELVGSFEDLPPRPADPLDDHDLNLVLTLDGIEVDPERQQIIFTTRALDGAGEMQGALRRLDGWIAAFRAADRFAAQGSRSRAAVALQLVVEEETDADQFASDVSRILEHIRAGDVFQTVLSRSLRVRSDAPPLRVYAELRRLEPAPYMFHFDLGEGVLLGASPECCLRVRGGVVEVNPIAGTVRRGRDAAGNLDADLDARLATSLILDPKEQAEHAMLVDLARNDVARVARPGTREVHESFRVVKLSRVQHLSSRVTGALDRGLDALDAYRACANMGTLTGAPKLRAMELIRELEPSARGTYGGALGRLTRDGEFDSCIVIRALRWKGGTYTVRVGAGVVAGSSPAGEARETRDKAQTVLRALQLAAGGEA